MIIREIFLNDEVKYRLEQIKAIYPYYRDELSLKRVELYLIKQRCIIQVKSKKSKIEEFPVYIPVATLDNGDEIPLLNFGRKELIGLENNLLKIKADSKQLSEMLNELIAWVD